MRRAALLALGSALLAGAWLILTGPAAAQAGCQNDAGDPITCVVPVIEKWPFASDWFTITIEDEATGERAPFPSYTTAAFTELKVEVTSPAGATISSERRGGTSYYHRCETENMAECVIYRVENDPPDWNADHRGIRFSFWTAESQRRVDLVPLRVIAPGGTTEVRLTATLMRRGVAQAVTETFTMDYSDAAELVVSTWPGYDFARVNGGGSRVWERDELQVWVGSSSLSFTAENEFQTWDANGLNGDGDPVFEISAPAGVQIWSGFMSNCGAQRDNILESPNRCIPTPTSLFNRGTGFSARSWAYGAGVYVQPPTSGSGTFDLTVTWRLNSGVQTDSATIRYGPEVPADLTHPYPVLEVSGPPAGSSFGYAAPIAWSARGIDARDGSPLPISEQAFDDLMLLWTDPDVEGSETDAELPVHRVLSPDTALYYPNRLDLEPEEIREALGGRSTWDADFRRTERAPLGSGGGLRGHFTITSPNVRGAGGFYRQVVKARQALPDYAYDATRLDSGPEVRARLPEDADQRLAPGATEPVEAGLGGSAPGPGIDRTLEPAVSFTRPCIHTADVEPGRHRWTYDSRYPWPPATWSDPATQFHVYTFGGSPSDPPVIRDFRDVCMWNDLVDGAESYLLLQGPARWADGSRRLRVGTGTDYPVFACGPLQADLGFVCSMRSETGALPELTVDADAEAGALVTLTASITQAERDEEHPGWVAGLAEQKGSTVLWGGATPPLEQRLSSIFGSVEFTVGGVRDVDLAVLEPVGGAAASTRAGGQLPLRLKILNSAEDAAPVSAISSATLAASGGGTISGVHCSEPEPRSTCTLRLGRGAPLAMAEGLEIAKASARIGDSGWIVPDAGKFLIVINAAGIDGPLELRFSAEALRARAPSEIGIDVRASPVYTNNQSLSITSRGQELHLLRTAEGELHIGFDHFSNALTSDVRVYSDDALETDPALTGDIRLTYGAPSRAAASSVTASVVATDGRLVTASLPISVGGPANALVVSGGGTARTSAVEGDLDELSFTISARDAGGLAAALPRDATVRRFSGPAGAAVASGLIGAISCSDDARLNCRLALTVTAPASAALAAGAYVAHLSGGALTGRAEFALAGAPKTIALSENFADRSLGGDFTVEALVADADGNLAADGTRVAFRVGGTVGGPVPLVLATPVGGTAETKDGIAAARLVAVSPRVGVISAATGPAAEPDASGALVLDMRGLGADGPPPLPPGFSRYRGSPISASELIEAQPEIGSISLWNGVRWITYAPDLPGRIDFRLRAGDIIHVSPAGPARQDEEESSGGDAGGG